MSSCCAVVFSILWCHISTTPCLIFSTFGILVDIYNHCLLIKVSWTNILLLWRYSLICAVSNNPAHISKSGGWNFCLEVLAALSRWLTSTTQVPSYFPTLHLLFTVCAVCVTNRTSLLVVKCTLIALVRIDLAPLSSCGILGSWNFLVHLAL